MRTCLLAYKFYETETRLQQYAWSLTKRGDMVDVIVLRREGEPKYEVLDGVNVYRIQVRKVDERGLFAYVFRMIQFFFHSTAILTSMHLAHPYQLIHVLQVPDFLVFAALFPKLLGARIILEIRDILPEFYASKFGVGQESAVFRLLTVAERWCAKFPDHVIIANPLWHSRYMARSSCEQKCTLISDCPDSRFFFPRVRERKDNRFLVMYPGTLNWHQGLDIAIKAFSRIVDVVPEAEFHIYGEGPSKPALIRLKDDLRLNGKVVFHGPLPIEQIAKIMADSDLAVVPKRAATVFGNEAVSSKILEFMALGVPVIVSRTKVDAYYYDDSLVRFFEPGNDSDLAECILSLKQDSLLRNRLVSNSMIYIRGNEWVTKEGEYFQLVDSVVLKKTCQIY